MGRPLDARERLAGPIPAGWPAHARGDLGDGAAAARRDTEYLATLEYLRARLRERYGEGDWLLSLYCGMNDAERDAVKRAFNDRQTWQPLTKKPLSATEEEATANPRAWSAKLRAARRYMEPTR